MGSAGRAVHGHTAGACMMYCFLHGGARPPIPSAAHAPRARPLLCSHLPSIQLQYRPLSCLLLGRQQECCTHQARAPKVPSARAIPPAPPRLPLQSVWRRPRGCMSCRCPWMLRGSFRRPWSRSVGGRDAQGIRGGQDAQGIMAGQGAQGIIPKAMEQVGGQDAQGIIPEDIEQVGEQAGWGVWGRAGRSWAGQGRAGVGRRSRRLSLPHRPWWQHCRLASRGTEARSTSSACKALSPQCKRSSQSPEQTLVSSPTPPPPALPAPCVDTRAATGGAAAARGAPLPQGFVHHSHGPKPHRGDHHAPAPGGGLRPVQPVGGGAGGSLGRPGPGLVGPGGEEWLLY